MLIYDNDQTKVREVIEPTFGKAAIFRSDMTWHESEVAYGGKKLITYFLNIRKSLQRRINY